ncbi:RidA family protein [Oligoflexaceae bacterium]|nr:RidA family protein [Oligoflexaceae bacterium]
MSLTKPFADYPHSRQTGHLLFMAGQGCRDPQTNLCCGLKRDADEKVVGYDIREQTEGVLKNVERVLQSSGLSRSDLVDVTVFLTDMNDFQSMNEVWNAFFEGLKSPTRTTVAVKQLPGENFIEMKAIAELGAKA